MTTEEILQNAAAAKTAAALLTTDEKNRALNAMADALEADAQAVIAANELDMAAAKGKVSDVMLDRLMLNESRIKGMARGIRDVVALPDPVGVTLEEHTISQDLQLKQVSVPLGVVAIIYESRPNVTSDAAALTLKSGNVCVLRGGKEAYNTAHAILKAMRRGLVSVGLPENLINMLDDTSRAGAETLMKARGLVDVLIPRGGAGLIRSCVENASVPVIETGTGICAVYVDKDADLQKALTILENAKTQRPSVCNACEQLLVHRDVAERFLPAVYDCLVTKREAQGLAPVELRLDEAARKLMNGTPAGEKDFDTEFLDYILAVRVVADLQEAVAHIAAHSTHHSEAIVTENQTAADYFAARVDSAAVYVNASTRFTDGGVFGLGCEMGISTQKLHARGPMGLKALTSYKYIVTGNGQVRK